MLIGGGGMIVGVVLAFLLYGFWEFDIVTLPADVYGTSKLPLDLSLMDFSLTIVGALIIIALSSFYPAKSNSN